MIDLGAFSDEDKFDAKKWINTVTSQYSRSHEENKEDNKESSMVLLEKHLADLEMKLQMMSEEISASLEEQSGAALLRVPRASRDVIRLRDDSVSLRTSVSGIIQKLKKVFFKQLIVEF